MVQAVFISTLLLLFYDWSLMLSLEVKYIWRATWNYTKVLYLLARYAPFVSLSLQLRNQFAPNPSPGSCEKSIQAACWVSLVGMNMAEVILFIRTYAVWNKDKRVGIGLAGLWVVCQVPSVVIAERFLASLNFIPNPLPGIVQGCVTPVASKLVSLDWVVFSVMEGVVLVLMIVSALRTYRQNISNLLNVIYVDGIRFYAFMFCATIVNVLITWLLPIAFIAVGSSLEVVIHSNLVCRLVLGLREAGHSTGDVSNAFELSELPNNDTVVFAHMDQHQRESAWVDLEARAGPSNS